MPHGCLQTYLIFAESRTMHDYVRTRIIAFEKLLLYMKADYHYMLDDKVWVALVP